jgi:hypothetical protein
MFKWVIKERSQYHKVSLFKKKRIKKPTASDLSDQTRDWHWRTVDIFAIQALVSHISAENASVSRQASYADSQMVIDGHDLFLMGRELRRGSLQRH